MSIESLRKRILRRTIGAVTHVVTAAPLVALTFDDGPHPEYTPRLLEILGRYNAQATFFVQGQAAYRYPAILAEMARGGHAIGNHSWDHPSFPTISRAERRMQLRAWASAVAPHGVPLFRPPYGHHTIQSGIDIRLMGYQVVTWNVLGRDWLHEPAEHLTTRIAAELQPGSIVLLHDALHDAEDLRAFDRTPTLLAVEQLLQQFSDRFTFVTVPALLQRGRPQLNLWERPPNYEWLTHLQPYTQRQVIS
jgi:peptidoglycan/xylan/chitin deacetylase (PgdA/CDA1 family)